MLTALQIGADPALLRTRSAVLESTGLLVVNSENFNQAMKCILAEPFDLAVLCHSLPRTDRLNLAAAVRGRHPSAFILLVSDGGGARPGENEGVDAVLEPEPHKLLHHLRQILVAPHRDAFAPCRPMSRSQAARHA